MQAVGKAYLVLGCLAGLCGCVAGGRLEAVSTIDPEKNDVVSLTGPIRYKTGSFSVGIRKTDKNLSRFIDGNRGCVNILVNRNQKKLIEENANNHGRFLAVKITGHFIKYTDVVLIDPIASQSSVYNNECGNSYFLVARTLNLM